MECTAKGREIEMTEEPKPKGQNGIGHEVFEHPAYGMVSICQTSGEAVLVGSAVKHGHFVSLEISTAERHKDNYAEHWMSRKLLCRISLSHAQLAEVLFSTNGSGVPCTLRYVQGDKDYRPEPPFVSPLKENSDNLHGVIKETLSRAAEMAMEVEALVKTGNLKKADRDRIGFLALKIHQDIESNIHFAMKCVDEKTEKTVAHAKAEIESFVNMTFKAAGIEHIKQENAKNLLGHDEVDGA
jgi:hypothetical protein